jgi:hypothetical protein
LKQLHQLTILPSVLQLSFWDCNLDDAEIFSSYQLPANCRICFKEGESFPIGVYFESTEHVVYQYFSFNQIRDLKQFLVFTRGLDSSKFELTSDSGRLDDNILLSNLPVKELKCIITEREFIFSTQTGQISFSLAPNATVAEAEHRFANLLGIPLARVLILDNTKPISNKACLVSSLSKPFISILHEYTFKYGSSTFTLLLGRDTTVSALRPQLDSFLGEPCKADKFDIALREKILFATDVLTPFTEYQIVVKS